MADGKLNSTACRVEERSMEVPKWQQGNSPLESPENRWIAATLVHRSGRSPNAPQIAAAVLSIWADIASALQSIIGKQGVAALYDRSLSLTAKEHPWIASARVGAKNVMDLGALETAVTQQTSAAAAAGAAELVEQFYDVLVSLIGSALSGQLLQTVRDAPTPSGPERLL